MTDHGDDCYFFYYSTCTKGDGCPFRHCEAAMGNETVCGLWREGRCFRAVCKFRHMEILKNRKEIPCYWERQPAGCQKPHCAFSHKKPRFNEGEFIPPNKSVNWMEEEEQQQQQQQQQQEEPAPPPPAPLPTTANPQLRGVIKTETQELVPSPTHPPVVINPADDDEDEDDQFSEDGEDGRLGPSPRKLHKSDDSLDIGVSTLEEIRLRRALKASMRRAGYPIQSAEGPANGEKENVRSFRPARLDSRDVPSLSCEEAWTPRGRIAARLGRTIPTTDVKREGPLLKRSLAQRLGGVVDVELPSEPPQKVLKPVRERLGLFSAHAAPAQPADRSEAPRKVPEQLRIKTLEEIRQEKATKSQHQSRRPPALLPTPEITVTRTSSVNGPKQSKRSVAVKHSPVGSVKLFSKTPRAKKKRQEEEPSPSTSPKVRNTPEIPEPSDAASPPREAADVGEVRVKTLEEIRREKAARLQVQQADVKKSSDSEDDTAKKPRRLRLQKLPGQSNQTGKVPSEQTAEETVKPVKPAAAPSETAVVVKVKSFEEIMREKRMRKQEEHTKGPADEGSPHNGSPAAPLKRKLPAKVAVSPAGSSPSPAPAPESPHESPVHKPAVRSGSASPPAAAAVASVPVKLNSSPQTPDAKCQRKNPRSSSAQPRAAPRDPPAEAPDVTTSKSSEDTKVRPKLNVKPSVMKPGQKRRGAKRSAVAAVKPLNSSSTAQETACGDSPVLASFGTEARLSSGVPVSPSGLLEAGPASSPASGPLIEKLQKGQSQESQPAAVPQSPVLKSPTQPKTRRLSMAASRSASSAAAAAAVDDFDDLINEFTDDHLEGDMDPGIGEDDLLQELTEMIDS